MYCEQITLKSGKKVWSCVADGPPDPVTGKRKQIPRRGKTKKEAMQRVREVIDSLNNDGIDLSVSNKMPFQNVAQEWIKEYALTGVKKNSVRVRKKEINMLCSKMALVPIGKISHAVYQRAINELAQDYERSTVMGAHSAARMIFRYAIRYKYIKDNPSIDIIVPKKRKTVDEVKENPIEALFLEKEELENFLFAAREFGLPLDKERFYLLALTGMRSGELCALQKEDLNFEENTIFIHKTLYNENNNMKEYELTPPKTMGSVRTIHVEKEVMNLLRKVVLRNDKHKLKYRKSYTDFDDGNFVFARDNGYPFAPKNITDRMRRLMKKTPIKKKATPHTLRHTHVSLLTEAGVDLPTIMQRVGHEDVETTMRIYTHVTDKMKKDATQKRESFFGNILNDLSI